MSAPAVKPDTATALPDTIDALVREERDHNQFIDQAFQAGRNLGLDDEAIRSAALSALHRHYNPPHYPASADQRTYEAALAERYRDRLPASTVAALEYILRQPDAQARLRAFLEGRPANELKKIAAFLAARGRK
jgi:hypothetical protein